MKKNWVLLGAVLCSVITIFAYQHWFRNSIADRGLQEVANGDAQFWLFQGAPNDRLLPCTVYYQFDSPLDETLVRDRLHDLVASYAMFNRNIVEIDGLPYWQSVAVDKSEYLRVLDAAEDIELVRKQAEVDVSRAAELKKGLPLFRAYLSADQKQLVFVWHHVISDFEGMFNKHAKHLFKKKGERTLFGYQVDKIAERGEDERLSAPGLRLLDVLKDADRQIGFTGANYAVTKLVLPIGDKALNSMGLAADLPMSDIFSFIALRTATRYEELAKKNGDNTMALRPLVSPISLRSSSLDMSEGNNRAVRQFPFVFPLEKLPEMHQRIVSLEPVSSSYDTAGKLMKLARKAAFIEPTLRKISMPDYISNYFPLADTPLLLGDARLVAHQLRVPMVPYERTKFAWSNYNGEVQLFLHTDPLLIDSQRMYAAFQQASKEVLAYLVESSHLTRETSGVPAA